MIRKFYIEDDGEGGGSTPAVTAPQGYKVSTPDERTQWNSFLDYVGKQQGVNLDADPKAGVALLSQYKKANPNFSLTPNDLQRIQYEQYQLRKGDSFVNLKPEQLKYLRQGLPEAYLNRPVDVNGVLNSNTAKLYYPQKTQGDKNYGTDVEGYINGISGNPAVASPTSPVAKQQTASTPDIYSNHDTALQRVRQLGSIKGNEFLHGRGDALINANYTPSTDTQSFRDSSIQAAKGVGLDPSLFWASAAEEGATGLIPDKDGNITTGDESHVDVNGKYPVDGFTNFGLDHFHDQFKELVKRGYLPKDFDYQKATIKNPENGEVVNSGNFKNVADALKAKAAFIRMEQDNLDDWTKKSGGVELSPTARQFFTVVAYNGGPGTAHKMINYYKSQGLLNGDKFLNAPPPKSIDPGDSYGKVLPRYKVAQLSKKEGIF